MEFLPELCSSDYKHAPMHYLNKHYYTVGSTGKLLCDECLTSFIFKQSKLIADAIFQHYQSAEQYKIDLFRDPNNTMDYSGQVPVLDFMRKVLGPVFQIQTKIWTYAAVVQFDQPAPPSILGKSTITLPAIDPKDPLGFEYGLQLTYYAYESENEKLRYLVDSICGALRAFIRGTMDLVTDDQMEALITATTQSKYSSSALGDDSTGDCGCSSVEPEVQGVCAHCGKALTKPYFIYHNAAYCLDDMYAIVVQQSVATHLADEVGLSDAEDTKSTNYRIMNTPEWKMSVISKYFKVMEGFDQVTIMYPIQ